MRRRRPTTTATCAARYYYVSHYRRGVVVYDAADPNQLVEVAHFDNYVTPSSNVAGTDGTWGVYPFLPSGNLLVSDIENGLFVLRDHTQTLNQNVGRVGFGGLAASGTEGAPSGVRVPVQRVGGLAGNVSVQYSVTAGSATEGVDYVASSGTLSWGAGNNGDKDIVIALPDDTTSRGSRDAHGDAVVADERRHARRLEHLDGHDRRQRFERTAAQRRWRGRRFHRIWPGS